MTKTVPIILIENVLDDLWICLPMRHKDFALKIMKTIEDGSKSQWDSFIDIYVNFGVGIGETAQEAQLEFYQADEESTRLKGIYHDNIFDRIVRKQLDIQLRTLPQGLHENEPLLTEKNAGAFEKQSKKSG